MNANWTIAVLVAYSVGMTGGQMLLKVAAARSPGPAGLVDRFLAQMSSPASVLALVTYVALLLVWTWILGFVPLNRAYPFVASVSSGRRWPARCFSTSV